MKTDLAVDFTVNRENKTITVKREFAAPILDVWEAYTNSDILDRWWAPKPWKAQTKAMDFRVGGKWLYAMVGPQGEEHWAVATYESIEEGKHFTGVDAFTDSQGIVNEDLPKSRWEVYFSTREKGTLVELKISYPSIEQLEETLKMGFQEGLLSAMENLDEIFASANRSL